MATTASARLAAEVGVPPWRSACAFAAMTGRTGWRREWRLQTVTRR